MNLRSMLPRISLPWLPISNRNVGDDGELLRRIRAAAGEFRELPGPALQNRAETLRQQVIGGGVSASSPEVLEEGFALVNEAVRRQLNLEYYDVQLRAGCALARGTIVEMATGEGKTLVQALAAFVLALPGKGVHVMTSNAYLAERDFGLLAPVYQQLGMTVGLVRAQASPADKAGAYRCEVTYGAGYEFGFDYLRDQSAWQLTAPAGLGDTLRQRLQGRIAPEAVSLQRGLAAALVDEADSVMIDEATTPLLLSAGPAGPADAAPYQHASLVAARLVPGRDFLLQERRHTVRLTPGGLERLRSPEFAPQGLKLERPWLVYVEQALIARFCLNRDVEYVVDRGRVVLVDQTTGRLFADRSLREGMHQAVEAKEQVPLTGARRTQARISRQQFFRRYEVLAGMTGTARDASREFRDIYRKPVVIIAPRVPCRRVVLPSRFFADKPAKLSSILSDVRHRHAAGQPVLVGTRSIEESLRVARLFQDAQLPCTLLNGQQDQDEARIIAQAGQMGAITIATHIAGRGTDIRLGPGVDRAGGLHVILAEPHVCTRVDRQLLGRTARQGDPGSCQMFVSAEDELLRLHGSRLARTMRRLADAGGEVHEDLSAEVAGLQQRAERMNFERRRQLLRRDAWLEDVLARLTGH